MRRDVCLGLFVLGALVASGCDTDQPLLVNTQNADLSITAIGARVEQYKVWDLVEDSDDDGVPDDVDGDGVDGDVTLWCEADGPGDPISVPWTFSVKIEVIRGDQVVVSDQGQIVPEQLTSAQAESDEENRANYDTFEGLNTTTNNPINVVHPRGACSTKPQIKCNPNSTSDWCSKNDGGQCVAVFSCSDDPSLVCDPNNPGTTCSSQGAGVCTSAGVCSGDPGIVCDPTCGDLGAGACIQDNLTRKYIFQGDNRRRLSEANRELLNTVDNFIAETCLGAPCAAKVVTDLGGTPLTPVLGICPGQDLGDPVLDPITDDANSDPTIFGFTLNKGDTVVVEARRSNSIPGGGQVIDFLQDPGLRAEFFVDGATLQSDEITGELVSSDPDSPSISFSFTSK